jgi:hypothetical protein
MSSLAEKYRKDEVIFLGLSLDRNTDAARRFVEKYDLKHFVGMGMDTARKYYVRYMPDAYVINHEGIIIWKGHPGDPNFERAIAYAVKNAPPAMLKDVYMGPFEEMRFELSGMKGFSKAYKKLRTEAGKQDSKDAKFAGSIIEVIDEILARKLEKIEKLIKDEPDKAMAKLKKFSFKFRGSPAADIAKQKLEKLKSELKSETEAEKPSQQSK